MNKGAVPEKEALKATATGRRSDRMLLELLALNEEMILQLRVERTDAAGTTDFLTGMIEQHELVASKLRKQLKSLQAATPLGKPLTC